MKIKNKKIYLLLAGGTVLSEDDSACVEKEADAEPWLNKMPELKIMANLEPVFICGESHNDFGPKLWQKLTSEIYSRLNNCDGIIVTSNLNNLLYNAISVSFGILNLNKPVVFTGSQLPIVNKDLISVRKGAALGLGIKANLINALQMATMDFGAAVLMFGNHCLRAVKAQRSAVYSLNIFNSIDDSYLFKIDFGISPQEKFILPEQKPVLKNNFAQGVVLLKYYPGLNFNCLKALAAASKGLMINVSDLQFFNQEFAVKLKSLHLPILVYDKFYVPSYNAENIIEVFGLTKETALVKFMWALGQAGDYSEIRELMHNEFCKEFIQHHFLSLKSGAGFIKHG